MVHASQEGEKKNMCVNNAVQFVELVQLKCAFLEQSFKQKAVVETDNNIVWYRIIFCHILSNCITAQKMITNRGTLVMSPFILEAWLHLDMGRYESLMV